MEIMRVVRDLVTTKRIHNLATMSMRVVEDKLGYQQVAVDPVGCRPGDFVITVATSAARHATGDPSVTTDMTINGIIDYWSEQDWHDWQIG